MLYDIYNISKSLLASNDKKKVEKKVEKKRGNCNKNLLQYLNDNTLKVKFLYTSNIIVRTYYGLFGATATKQTALNTNYISCLCMISFKV